MYKSKRICISYPAVERLAQAYGLPEDLPSQTLAGYVERLIFECLCQRPSPQLELVPATTPKQVEATSIIKPNASALARLAKNSGMPPK